MNAHVQPEAPIAVPHPLVPDCWLVTFRGKERTITQEGNTFIAHFCEVRRHASFNRALKACEQDIRDQLWMEARPVMLPVPASEAERWLIDYSDADNSAERAALMARNTTIGGIS